MKTPIVGGTTSLDNTATMYCTLSGGGQFNGDSAKVSQPMPTAGTLHSLRVVLSEAPTTNPYIFTVYVAGAPQLTCTVAVGSTTAQDLVTQADIAAGNLVTLETSFSAAPGNTPSAYWSVIFEGDDGTESILLGGTYTSSLSSSTNYQSLERSYIATGAKTSDAFGLNSRFPAAGTLKKLYLYHNKTDTDTHTAQLYLNGNPTTLQATFTNGACAPDTSHTVSVADDDYAQMVVTRSGSITAGSLGWGMVFVPGNAGDFVLLHATPLLAGPNDDTQAPIISNPGDDDWDASGTAEDYSAFPLCRLKKIRAAVDVAPGAGVTRTFRVKGPVLGDLALAVAIAGASQTDNYAEATVDIAVDSLLCFKHSVTGSPAAVTGTQIGLLGTMAAPTVTSLDITSGKQGAKLSVVLTGTSFTGATAVSFGSGITVNSFTVDSDTQITADLVIAGNAALGLHDESVTTAMGTGTLAGGFEVLPGGGNFHPTIASIPEFRLFSGMQAPSTCMDEVLGAPGGLTPLKEYRPRAGAIAWTVDLIIETVEED